MNKYLITANLADKLGFPEESDLFFNLLKIKIAQEDNLLIFNNNYSIFDRISNKEYKQTELRYKIKNVIVNIENTNNINGDEEIFEYLDNTTNIEQTSYLIMQEAQLPIFITYNNKKTPTYINWAIEKTITGFIGNESEPNPTYTPLTLLCDRIATAIIKELKTLKEKYDTEILPHIMLIDKIYDKQIQQSKLMVDEYLTKKIKSMLVQDFSLIGAPIKSLIELSGHAQVTVGEFKDFKNIIKVFGNKSLEWILSQAPQNERENIKIYINKYITETTKELEEAGDSPEKINSTITQNYLFYSISKINFHDAAHVLPTSKTPRELDKLSTFLLQNSNKSKIQLKEITAVWERIPEDIKKEAFTKGYEYILNYVRNNVKLHENATDVAFSRESGKWGIENENKYKILEDYYKSSQNTPLPEWTKYSVKSGNYIGKFLPRNDPRGMFLGQHTNCCQHPEGAGSYSAFHGQGSPTGAFFVIEDTKGTILCQSWVWEDNKEDLVFDNAESILKEDDPRRKTFAEIYKLISEKLPARNVYLGAEGNDIEETDLHKIKFEPLSQDDHEYTDIEEENYLLSHKPYIANQTPGRFINPPKKGRNPVNLFAELGQFEPTLPNNNEKNKFSSQPHYTKYQQWDKDNGVDNFDFEDEGGE